MTKALSLLSLLLSSAFAFTQTTTTYNVVQPYTGGVYSYPFRLFNQQLEQGAKINWLQIGNSSCAGQTPGAGFIFLTLPSGAALPCATVTRGSSNAGNFQGVDTNSVPFSGSYIVNYTVAYKCSGGRGGGCHSVFTVTGGSVTFTQ